VLTVGENMMMWSSLTYLFLIKYFIISKHSIVLPAPLLPIIRIFWLGYNFAYFSFIIIFSIYFIIILIKQWKNYLIYKYQGYLVFYNQFQALVIKLFYKIHKLLKNSSKIIIILFKMSCYKWKKIKNKIFNNKMMLFKLLYQIVNNNNQNNKILIKNLMKYNHYYNNK